MGWVRLEAALAQPLVEVCKPEGDEASCDCSGHTYSPPLRLGAEASHKMKIRKRKRATGSSWSMVGYSYCVSEQLPTRQGESRIATVV